MIAIFVKDEICPASKETDQLLTDDLSAFFPILHSERPDELT